ncbi:MAG TPA: alkaline phosphatase PhoX [Devosiaceae bacterium]
MVRYLTLKRSALMLATATALVSAVSGAHAQDAVQKSREAALAQTSVYRVGFPVEVAIKAGVGLGDGAFAANATAAKHFSMGRLAWELAYVMPDSRTVYAGDDGTNRGMFRYVADKAGDLTSGELFAARLTQTTPAGAPNGEFTISWISLGHANDADIDAAISRGVKFSDLFETADVADNACPAGFTPVEIESGAECLKLRTENSLGMSAEEIATVASRIETLRYAAIKGATTEFRKFEGITYNEKRHKLYLSISEVGKAMAAAPKLAGVSDDINVAANKCGAVYQLSVGNDMATTDMKVLVAGGPFDKGAAVNECDINNIASPDNVVAGPTDDLIFIGEDTDYHQNDVVWAYDLNEGSLARVFTTPYGSETTSPFYYKNIDPNYDLMMTVVQHPYGESDEDKALSPSDTRAYIGYVAIPKKIKADDKVSFAPIPAAVTDAEKRKPEFTGKMTVNGETVATGGYNTLFRSGDVIGKTVWGQAIAKDGTPLVNYSRMDLPEGVSTSPDHSSLLKTADGELYTITQFEEGTGTMYISGLDLDSASGRLVVTGSKPVDLSPAYGGYTFCAGMPTPWGTHLGGEEYPTDARAFEANGNVDKYFDPYLEYFGFNPNAQ